MGEAVDGRLLEGPPGLPAPSTRVNYHQQGNTVHANNEPYELLEQLQRCGAPCKTFQRLKPPHDRVRDEVRDGTKKKVAQELGIRHFGQPISEIKFVPQHCNCVCLFTDDGTGTASEGKPGAVAGGNFLLGRFDVLALSAAADFDASWHFVRGGKPFWVLHAAALNIGENEHATDFKDYSMESGKLDFLAYIEDMGRIYDNILQSAAALGVTDMVFFPFGMGAFLRNLYKLDSEYSQDHLNGQRLQELRQGLAQRFVSAISDAKVPFAIHLCIAPSGKGDELDANSTAFLSAVLQGIKDNHIKPSAIKILQNADALATAHILAERGSCCALVNGANRRMVGNHWFSHGARMAIDENLHRRSWRMACTAYLLNDGAEAKPRDQHDLANMVLKLGGKGAVQTLATASDSNDTKSRVIKLFRQWDASGDGRISQEEMCRVLVKLGMSDEDSKKVFQEADTNSDNFVSYHEFVYWLYGAKGRPSLKTMS
ncbi:unnamed protein product [Effrenium voratum]|nr:unnamed protein product [Effrenium voratum]|mmetsp:Transcript_33246/g.79662  ORF Transcript_33246/g.79662 Transcript_33246/m.79662 type:complete len:485 (-) Transcript_33246:66-1520(-)